MFALLVTPIIVIHWGWHWAFYSFGAVGVAWWGLWHRNVAAQPEAASDNRRRTNAPNSPNRAVGGSLAPPTMRELLSCGPVWAIIVAHFCTNWGGYVLLAWMPTYITKGLGVDFASVGVFAVIPSMCSFLFLNVAGWVTDRLIRRGWDVTTARKTMQTIGFGGAATTLMFVGYIHDATRQSR